MIAAQSSAFGKKDKLNVAERRTPIFSKSLFYLRQ